MHALRSERLDQRPFTLADVQAISSTYGDPEVMRYVGHGVVGTADGVERMLRAYMDHQERHGFAVWAVIERATGTVVGDAGLFTQAEGEIELGYTLRRDAWGRGMATEAAGAWVRAAREDLGLTELVAQTDLPNTASAHVLGKLGFAETGRRMAYGREHRAFRLTFAR